MIQLDITKDDAEWLVGWLENLLGPLQFDDINPDSIRMSGILKQLKIATKGGDDVEQSTL